jgi:thiol-disulfide isomerase/thioredoxin
MKQIVAIVLLFSIIGLTGCSRKEAPQPAIEGVMAPDFTVQDLLGKETRLSALKGQVLLVNFWATWCPPCREEVPSMAALNLLMGGKPFRMLAISIDEGGKAAVESFLKQANASLPAYLDSNGAIGRMYGITGVPETFVIDRKGVIIKKVIGPLDWSAPDVVKFLNENMQ